MFISQKQNIYIGSGLKDVRKRARSLETAGSMDHNKSWFRLAWVEHLDTFTTMSFPRKTLTKTLTALTQGNETENQAADII